MDKSYKVWLEYGRSSTGCVLEVDLEYPTELYDLHNDYPLASDKLKIKKEMLPNEYNISIGNIKKTSA